VGSLKLIISSAVAMTVCAAANPLSQDISENAMTQQCKNSRAGLSPSAVVDVCTKAISAHTERGLELAVLLASRANAYDGLGDTKRALADYNEAIHLAPTAAGIYYNRGVYFEQQGDLSHAVEDYSEALRLEPTLLAALYNRAEMYSRQGNNGQALADYSAAIRINPKVAVLFQGRGLVHLRDNRFQEALEDESTAVRLDPNLALPHLLRAIANGRLGGSPEEVLTDAEAAIRLDPRTAQYVKINGTKVSITPPF
jgi:tetratricopeptide (TPR) repeat protein